LLPKVHERRKKARGKKQGEGYKRNGGMTKKKSVKGGE